MTATIPGPPKRQQVTVRDSDGINAVTNIRIVNGRVSVPSTFHPGDVSVVLTATKLDQSQLTVWSFDVTDQYGTRKHCA